MRKTKIGLLALAMALVMVLSMIGASAAETKKLLEVSYQNINVTLDGKNVDMKDAGNGVQAPFVVEGTIYAPIRAISEALGLNVEWDGAGSQIHLSTPDQASSFVLPEKTDKSTQPRIIITTDLEVDDMNGIMLSLMYASDYDLAGIVWTAGMFHFSGDGVHTLAEITPNYRCEAGTYGHTVKNPGELMSCRPVDPTFLTRMIDVFYRADYEYLSKNNPNYPTPDHMLSIAKVGNVEFEGDYRNETDGSQLIYDCIMDNDPRPLYIQHWGGINTTIRALYSIYEDYHGTPEWESVLKKVTDKVRLIGSGEDNCRADSKIDEMFPGLKDSEWTGFGGLGDYFQALKKGEGSRPFMGTNETLNPYYQAEWLTDAFKFGHGQVLAQFHLMNDGQYIYGEPMPFQYGLKNYISWDENARLGYHNLAERPEWSRNDYDTFDWMCCQFGCESFVDLGLRQGVENVDDRYIVALFEDLAARADWAIMEPADCNHAPVVRVEKQDISAKASQIITLKGSATDPDGDKLNIQWWVPAVSCKYEGGTETLSVSDADKLTTQFTVPADATEGDRFVVNLEAQDNADRPMTRFAQVVITVET